MRGANRRLFSKLNSTCKKKTIHGELSGTLPLEREQKLFAASPTCCCTGKCTLLCVHGGGGKVSPLPQHCTLLVHEEATLPLSLLPLLWPLPLQLPSPSPLPSLLPSLLPLLLPSSIAIAVAVAHCRCGCCQPLPLPSLLRCCLPLPLLSPLQLAIAVSVTVSHRSCRLCWPSPSSSQLAISESCCLGLARIVFKKFKYRILTLFYVVQPVDGALIKAG
jgi:hypothetical protein